jgi:hypothetical protein
MGTPNKLLVPEKRQINEFHRVISPGESETKNSNTDELKNLPKTII